MAYKLRRLDRVVVKGRNEPISIYEVLDGLGAEERNAKLATRDRFDEARIAYGNQAFDVAEKLFGECLARSPGDVASELYIMRCRRLAVEGVPPGWHGESVLTDK